MKLKKYKIVQNPDDSFRGLEEIPLTESELAELKEVNESRERYDRKEEMRDIVVVFAMFLLILISRLSIPFIKTNLDNTYLIFPIMLTLIAGFVMVSIMAWHIIPEKMKYMMTRQRGGRCN